MKERMKVRKSILIVVLVACLGLLTPAWAGTVNLFPPPTDPTGLVYTSNTNDAYSSGRGMVFEALASMTITSVGIYQDLTGIGLNFNVAEVLVLDGDVRTGQTILRSGSRTVTTSGLEFVDFGFSPLTLSSGGYYHIEFAFDGNSNQNFFYSNLNPVPGPDVRFTVGNFGSLDGTQDGSTDNYVMPAVHVEVAGAGVPEPSCAWLVAAGLLALAGTRRRMRRL
jgi:hypothetical protein